MQNAAVFSYTINSLLSSFVPYFRILTKVVAEKSFDRKKIVHLYYIRVQKEKSEKLKKKPQ